MANDYCREGLSCPTYVRPEQPKAVGHIAMASQAETRNVSIEPHENPALTARRRNIVYDSAVFANEQPIVIGRRNETLRRGRSAKASDNKTVAYFYVLIHA